MSKDSRGQVQTIEGFIATFIMLAVLAVVVQATSVTPLTTSFTNQHIKYELQNMGQDILTSLDEIPDGYSTAATITTPSRLEKSLSDWLKGYGGDWFTYNGIDKYVSATTSSEHVPTTYLEKALTFAFSPNGIAYNVEVRYPDTNGVVKSAKMIWNGDPSDNCVTVSRYVALHDDDGTPYSADLDPTLMYLIPDISPGTTLHNIVEVRLTLWVM